MDDHGELYGNLGVNMWLRSMEDLDINLIIRLNVLQAIKSHCEMNSLVEKVFL